MRRVADFLKRAIAAPSRRERGGTAAPRVPVGAVVYAIGDVHGRSDLLDSMLGMVRADASSRLGATAREVVFLGDYVDRGPDSRGVLDLLTSDPLPGFATTFLMGNHDAVMRDFLADPSVGTAWLAFGGDATLVSYGVPLAGRTAERLAEASTVLAERLPATHRSFLRSLKTLHTAGDYAFAHAGILPGVPLARQVEDDVLWIRDGFLEWRRPHEKMIVHGHSIVDHPVELSNRIAIDTGAYQTGRLTCLVLEGADRRYLST